MELLTIRCPRVSSFCYYFDSILGSSVILATTTAQYTDAGRIRYLGLGNGMVKSSIWWSAFQALGLCMIPVSQFRDSKP